jgi:hypothetical protein
MKNIFFIGISCAVLFIHSGCLKDKDFENKKYGMQIAENKGVTFPQSQRSPVRGAFTAQTTPVVLDGPFIALEQNGNAATDVHVTLQVNDNLVTAAGFTPLPAGSYTVSDLQVLIPKGQRNNDQVRITIPNSTILDPTKVYGVGFTISSADAGYKIAANQKNVVMAFAIKNKYDGVYTLRIKTAGWGAYGIADGVSGEYPGEVNMITTNVSSVSIYTTEQEDGLQPAFTGGVGSLGSATAFGATTPLLVFDPATDKLEEVRNTTPDDGRGRTLTLNTAVTDSRFDPATRTIYAAYIMKQNGRPDQFIYDTLTYIRERD